MQAFKKMGQESFNTREGKTVSEGILPAISACHVEKFLECSRRPESFPRSAISKSK
ncbi:hypothetical protein LEP1GSC047_3585 [Leptospira inadai serovar Lyme str. 10]|uniref:Lipoprotein n=1 Tax=Leptospira inadai serovar Lyme str. 10 TaxID=1049790 RepID=V6HX28_9LEPT|nr:hypothetical protein LEP1GSC047_3585 [Leptospira inadai serovar Lyme str. 10]